MTVRNLYRRYSLMLLRVTDISNADEEAYPCVFQGICRCIIVYVYIIVNIANPNLLRCLFVLKNIAMIILQIQKTTVTYT